MIGAEKLVTLSEATAFLPKIHGRKIHASTLWRWSIRGIGGVHLECRRLGGRLFVSVESLDRFADQVAKVSRGKLTQGPSPANKPPSDHQRGSSLKSAERVLRAGGILQ